MDQITIEAARRGDRTAQAALLQRLGDPWFRMCVSLIGNAEDARDAVQETALRFLRDLPRFRGDSSLMTWSMGIAVNVTREMRRRTRPSLSFDDGTDEPAAPLRISRIAPAPDAAATATESREMLRSTLRELPDRQREAIVLRYLEELSVEETAAAMDCAIGTVKATVHQALRSLKMKLNTKFSS